MHAGTPPACRGSCSRTGRLALPRASRARRDGGRRETECPTRRRGRRASPRFPPMPIRSASSPWSRIGSHAMRAVLLALALLALVTGCGGGSDGGSLSTDTTTTASGSCENVDAPDPRDPGEHEAPTERRWTREELLARLRYELRLVHGRARPGIGAEDQRVARRARGGRLLRQHALPPRRTRLRDPGR